MLACRARSYLEVINWMIAKQRTIRCKNHEQITSMIPCNIIKSWITNRTVNIYICIIIRKSSNKFELHSIGAHRGNPLFTLGDGLRIHYLLTFPVAKVCDKSTQHGFRIIRIAPFKFPTIDCNPLLPACCKRHSTWNSRRITNGWWSWRSDTIIVKQKINNYWQRDS
jgi:hypothetical protein